MNQFYVVLYSKFSQSSQKFLNSLNSSNIGINFNILNIDNPNSRQKILSNKKLNIKNVPCLLVVYQDNGSVEKYEGQDCFIWLNDIISQKQQQKLIELQLQQQQIEQQKIFQQKQKNNIIEEDNDDNDDEEQFIQPIPKKNKNKQKQKSQATFIDDINSDDEIDISNLDDLEQFETNDSSYEQPIKKRPSDIKRDSLLMAASEMAKLREIDDKKLKNDTRPI